MIIKKDDKNSIQIASDILSNGGIAILPTDTVYGFSGIVDTKSLTNTFDTDGQIRKIKGRSETKPLIQLIAKPEDIFLYTNDDIPSSVMEKWPGPLTVIVNLKEDCPLVNKAGLPTVAFRCPGDEWLRKIIESLGAPLYSTSVNRSGQPVLESPRQIIDEFEKEAALIVDDGEKKGALPSTLISIQDGNVKVLRQGAVVI